MPAILLLVVASARVLARSRTIQLFGDLVAEVPIRDSLVALTVDDGPTTLMADSLIDLFRAHHAQATFFVIGGEMVAAPGVATRLVAAGHELGNHSWSHRRMVIVSPARVRVEVERTDSLLRAAGQREPIWFRPPYSYKLVTLPWYLWRTNRTTVMWSIEPDSYADVASSPSAIVRYVLDRVHPGSIVLLHAWYPNRRTSRAAIGPLVDSLHARGYRVVTVGALLRAASSSRP